MFDKVLVAVGRRPNSANLGLDKAGVAVDERGFVKVDEQRRTSNPNIFAIGDLAGGRCWLTRRRTKASWRSRC